jgi:gas vesicle protein GvpL/GvpF
MANRVAPKAKPSALYLYGITQKNVSLAPDLVGVDGRASLEAMECEDLVCWISRVDKSEFADNLARNMENLDWLAEASVRHQRAVSAIAEQAEILPARLGTIFLSPSSLEADVRKKKRILEADFSSIKDSDEWGVKVFAVANKPALPAQALKSGKDYLKAKAAKLQKPATKGPDPEIERFAEALGRIAVRTADGGKISGAQRGLKWQTSLLLKRSDRRKLEALLTKFSKEWEDVRRIECSGPWPPYSFVTRASAESGVNG